ncbi:hypothetical protein [Miltoncostaea oceani]|uniref:hypothetical protein n=1 Tax=Miltoncostaea oceani TaxID=2843216 RepID=UPI001C3D81FA|nr:hypothetical protein [Miltoncostaea oceani]
MTTSPTRRLAAALCALAIGAVAAGCGGESSTGGTTTAGTTATTGTTATAPALTLVERLPTPSEFGVFPAGTPVTADLGEFADALGDGDSREERTSALTTAGFRRGALLPYEAGDDGYALAYVAEVDADAAPALAETIVAAALDSRDRPELSVAPFTTGTGAQGAEISGTRDGTAIAGTTIVFSDGGYVYGVQVARQGGPSARADAEAAVAAWTARVTGAPPAPEDPPSTTGTTTGTTGSSTTGEAPFPDPGEVALLAKVPPATADDCSRTSETARATKATSSVRCDTQDHRVYYEQFATVDDMREAYDAYLELNDVSRNEGTTCDAGAPAEGVWDGPDNRVACFIDSAGAWVVWNSVDLRLVAVAIDPDSNLDRVFAWWEGPESGPIL